MNQIIHHTKRSASAMLILLLILFYHVAIALTLLIMGHKYCEKQCDKYNFVMSRTFRFIYSVIHNTKLIIHPASVNLEPGKPYLIISNHKGVADYFVSILIFRNHTVRYIAKKSLVSMIPVIGIPAYSLLLRIQRNCFIDRSKKLESLQKISRFTIQQKKENKCVLIFPEGTRYRGDLTKDFHTAAIKLIVKKSNMPIVLLGLQNTQYCNTLINVKLKNTVHAKILGLFTISSTKEVPEMIGKFRKVIDAQLLEWRNEDKK